MKKDKAYLLLESIGYKWNGDEWVSVGAASKWVDVFARDKSDEEFFVSFGGGREGKCKTHESNFEDMSKHVIPQGYRLHIDRCADGSLVGEYREKRYSKSEMEMKRMLHESDRIAKEKPPLPPKPPEVRVVKEGGESIFFDIFGGSKK